MNRLPYLAVLCGYFASLFAGVASGAEPRPGNFPSRKLTVGSKTREYRLVVPSSVRLDRPAPLVVAYHGMLIDSKDFMPVYTGLNEAAEKHQFVLAYPNAVQGSFGLFPDKTRDDLACFDALLKDVRGEYSIDARRIYVTGMSNGGYFAHLVAKERSTVIAAAAPHSTMLGLQTLGGIQAERKFPVLIVHGDRDRIFPLSVARENRDKYAKEGHKVELLELPGVGHTWGDKEKVNDAIWKFFAANPLPEKKGKTGMP